VGRILTRLKARGVLREPLSNGIKHHRRRVKRPYATRKPREYQAKQWGTCCRWIPWTFGLCQAW
jgi:hypothetical protein